MPLELVSKQAAYGDDKIALSKDTVASVQKIKNNLIAFQTLIDKVTADPDMTQVEIDELTSALDAGHQYVWNQIDAVVPAQFKG